MQKPKKKGEEKRKIMGGGVVLGVVPVDPVQRKTRNKQNKQNGEKVKEQGEGVPNITQASITVLQKCTPQTIFKADSLGSGGRG